MTPPLGLEQHSTDTWSSRNTARHAQTGTCTWPGTERGDEGHPTPAHAPQPAEQTHSPTHCWPHGSPSTGLVPTCPDDADPREQLLAKGQQVAGLAGAGRAQGAAVLCGESREHRPGAETRRGEAAWDQRTAAGNVCAAGNKHARLLVCQPIRSLVPSQS